MSERKSFPWIPIILVVLLVGAVTAVRYLPWWGVVLFFAVPILGWKYIAAAIFAVMVRQTAKGMARALLGAKVDVHTIRAVPPPEAAALEAMLKGDNEDEDDRDFEESIKDLPDDPPDARDWYEIDATITPEERPR